MHRSNLIGYENVVFLKLDELADATKAINQAKDNGADDRMIKELKLKESLKFFELEELGLTTSDRYNANPSYWNEKAFKAKQAIENPKSQPVVGFESNDDLHYVHQTDLALKRTAILTVPVWNVGGITVPLPIVSTGWNAGTSTASWPFVPTDGDVTFDSKVCLAEPTHHSSVDFDMQVVREIKYFWGTILYSFDNTYDENHDSQGDCTPDRFEKRSIKAGSSAKAETGISNISLN